MAAKKRDKEADHQDIIIHPMHNSAEKKLAVPDDLKRPVPDERSTVFTQSNQGLWNLGIQKKLSLLLIPVALVIIALLVSLNIPTAFEPPLVLPLMNTVFLGIIPIVIAYVTFKVYTKNGSASVLLIGSGILIFGLGSIVAGWVNPLYGGPNMTVTIHNTCACIGSILIFAGAVMSHTPAKSVRATGNAGPIVAAYAGIVVFVTIFSLATLQGMIPPFFVPGSGPTVLRQVILENATALFALSSVLFMVTYRKGRSVFFFWYSVALALIAIGLLAVFFQPSVGSLIGWTGRSAQYIGFVFALYGVLIARKTAMAKGVPLEDVIGNFFVDAEQNYRQLVETVTDAIITFDEDYRVLLWNSAAERMFGYPRDEAIGASFLKLMIDDQYIAVIKNYEQDHFGRDIQALTPDPVEIVGKRKGGALFQVELTMSRRWQEGRLILTCILRDITERKRAEKRTEHLSSFPRLTPVLILETDAHGSILYANPAICRSLEAMGESDPRIFIPQDIRDRLNGTVITEFFHEIQEIEIHDRIFQVMGFFSSEFSSIRIYASEITERKRAEEELLRKSDELVAKGEELKTQFDALVKSERMTRLSEERLIMAQEIGRTGSWEYNVQTGKIWGSAEGFHIYGFPPVAGAFPLDDIEACIPERERVHQALVDLITKGKEYNIECVINPADGTAQKIIHSIARLEKDEQGNPLKVVGVIHDITDIWQIKALRESEERFRLLLQHIPSVSVQGYNMDGTTQYWNDASESLYGYTAQEAVGKNLVDLIIPPEMREDVRKAMTSMAESGQPIPASELSLMRKDGTRVAVFSSHAIVKRPGSGTELFCIDIDLTERKRAEEVLQQSEEKYRLAMDATSDGLWDWDVRTNRVYYSPAWLKILGEDSIPPVFGSWEKRIHPDDRVMVISSLREQLEGKTGTWQCEHRLSMNSGGWKWVLGRGQVVARNPEGSPLRVVGTMLDITERKRAEEALRESEERHHQLLEAMTEAVYVLDTKWNYLLVNKQAAENVQMRPGEMINKNQFDLFPNLKNTAFFDAMQLSMEKRVKQQVVEKFSINQQEKWYELKIWPIPEGILCVSDDITERKRAEMALQDSNELFTQYIRHSPFYTFIKTVTANESRILYVSDTYNPMTGLSGRDMVGKNATELLPAEVAAKVTADDWAVISNGTVQELIREYGGRHYNILKFPIVQRDKILLAGYTIDITERKRAEETIQHALAEKEVLLREIHHRVKNNLSGILSLIELQTSSLSDPVQIAPFKDLESRIRSMALVHESLSKTKDLARINIASYTENLTRHLLSGYGTALEVRCRIEMGDITLPIETATPCGLVMNEIVTNSLKYAFPKTFSCKEIRGEPCTITLTLQREGSDYILIVADNGIGMPEGTDSTMSHSLGLFLIRFIVEHQLRGSLENSNVRGTVYTIRFPAPAVKEGNTDEKM